MSEPVCVDLSAMEQYIGEMDEIFTDFYEAQSAINFAYNKVKPVWYDQISQATGTGLWDTGEKMEQMSRYFSRMLRRLNEGYQMLDCNYGENRAWEVQFHDKELEYSINVEEEPMTRQIRGTTVEGIMRFEAELSDYIEKTGKNVRRVVAAYDGMRGYWDDSEYRRTGEKIEEFQASMNGNLKALDELLVWIEERRRQFQESLITLSQRDGEL